MRLGLGTAQFGSAYGITNRNGQVSADDVLRILHEAARSGVQIIDTAAAYGDAEAVLGRALWRGNSFRIVTKTRPLGSPTLSKQDVCSTIDEFKRSLDRLGQDRVYGLLLHHGEELLRPGGEMLADSLAGLRQAGLVERIGVSCYTPQELRKACRMFTPDLVQIPANILDRRFLDDGILAELRSRGTEIHARSAFLQGLLLTPCDALPAAFERHRPAFARLDAFAGWHGLTRLEMALAFLGSRPEIDVVLVGVTCTQDLAGIVAATKVSSGTPLVFDDLGYDDESLLIPSRWREAVLQETAR